VAKQSIGKYLKTAGYIAANAKNREAIYPFYASYKITHKCNFRCKFCNVWKEDTPDLDTEGAKKVIDNLANSSVMVLSIEGGDPLLREDIGEILEHVNKTDMQVFITTSERELEKYPIEKYAKYLDYLHISVDEGHRNLFMLDKLPTFVKWGIPITIQIVVTKDDIPTLEAKIKRCFECGAKAVVMPAVHLDNTMDYFPVPKEFSAEVLRLRKKYPNTIITPAAYLKKLETVACDASSIIIDSNGEVFYPCRTKAEKAMNLTEVSLLDFVRSEQAIRGRQAMKVCDRHCLWYQYFATQFYVHPMHMFSSAMPYVAEILGFGTKRRRKKVMRGEVPVSSEWRNGIDEKYAAGDPSKQGDDE
jgi:MoaA/NifB/PqqE/SkfB family radical SAM enzyme